MSKANNPRLSEQLEELTLEYIDRIEAGEKLTLGQIKRDHPDLADELSANLMEYLLVGQDEIGVFEGELNSAQYRADLNRRLNDPTRHKATSEYVARLTQPLAATNSLTSAAESSKTATEPIISLYEVIDDQDLTPPALARELNISSDLLLALEQRRVRLSGIPRLLLKGLAERLQVSLQSLLVYLAQPAMPQAQFYTRGVPADASSSDFTTLVAQSPGLSAEQKAYWYSQAASDAVGEDDLPTT